MLLTPLFLALGLMGVQPSEDIPIHTTEYISGTRYEFEHQEKEYIVDLNDDQQIAAFYINNEFVINDPQNRYSIGLEKTQHEINGVLFSTTEYISGTRYEFDYQGKKFIIDLSDKEQIVAIYVNNVLIDQNSTDLIREYYEKIKENLEERSYNSQGRVRRGVFVVAGAAWGVYLLFSWMVSTPNNNDDWPDPSSYFDLDELSEKAKKVINGY